MIKNLEDHYRLYLNHLVELVKMKSVFTEPDSVELAIKHCEEILKKNLNDYKVWRDDVGNLIAVPENFDSGIKAVYLSAHIDTVDAEANEWDTPFHPWDVHENKEEIVGRGVNDCKAGVALQLFISELISLGELEVKNLCFLITFKEEGAGMKTGREIGKELGQSIPLSQKENLMLVLENNVRVSETPTLCIYSSERSNYAIELEGDLNELQMILQRLKAWNPTCIQPIENWIGLDWEIFEQEGGHACSVERDSNMLTRVILGSNSDSIIRAGDRNNFASVPSQILKASLEQRVQHRMALNKRCFQSYETILEELEGLNYSPIKDMKQSEGFDLKKRFEGSQLKSKLEALKTEELNLEFTYNVGASDGTIIFNSMRPELREHFTPLVMGPGSRSQREVHPVRLTHGKNETFNKEAGLKALHFILRFIDSNFS